MWDNWYINTSSYNKKEEEYKKNLESLINNILS